MCFIYTYICMYACMHACMCVCVCVCVLVPKILGVCYWRWRGTKEWAYLTAHEQHLMFSFYKVQPAKKASPGCWPGNASPTVKSTKGPSQGRERRYNMKSIECQTTNPFSEVGRWLFVVPLARGRTVVLPGLLRMGRQFSQKGAWVEPPGSRLGPIF